MSRVLKLEFYRIEEGVKADLVYKYSISRTFKKPLLCNYLNFKDYELNSIYYLHYEKL